MKREDVNMMESACGLLQAMSFHSPVPFSNNLWHAFVAMYNAFDKFGYDFLTNCVVRTGGVRSLLVAVFCLTTVCVVVQEACENFIKRDRNRFVCGDPASSTNYVALIWKMVEKPLRSGNEDDVAIALRLVCDVLLTHPGAHMDVVRDISIKQVLVPFWTGDRKPRGWQIKVHQHVSRRAAAGLFDPDGALITGHAGKRVECLLLVKPLAHIEGPHRPSRCRREGAGRLVLRSSFHRHRGEQPTCRGWYLRIDAPGPR